MSASPARCFCGCAKRTHNAGLYTCRKHRACARYEARDGGSTFAQYKARYDAESERLRALNADARLRAENALPPGASRTPHVRQVDAFKFRSFAALLADAQQPPIVPGNRVKPSIYCASDWNDQMTGNVRAPWATGDCPARTLPDVARWLLHGWDAGVKRMRDALGDLRMPVLADIRRRGAWSDVGDVLSLDRLYSGNVETCWRTTHKKRAGAPPRLQIVVDAAMGSVTDGMQAGFWRGACAAAFAEAASAAGYAVAVDTCFSVAGYTEAGASYLQMTRVKDYDAPLNLSTLTAITAHPAAFRIVTFAHMYSRALDQTDKLLGMAAEITENALRERAMLDHAARVLIVPQDTTSEYAAREWLRAQVEQLEALGQGAA